MEELKEYAKFSSWQPDGGNAQRLIELAKAGESRERAKEIFNISENHFNVLYKKTKDNLVQGILNNSLKDIERIKRIRFDIRKQYAIVMTLFRVDKKSTSLSLARSVMLKAEKYYLYPIALDLSREIRRYYCSRNIDKKLYRFYTKKYRLYQNELELELMAKDLFFEYIYQYKIHSPQNEIVEKLNKLSAIKATGYYFHYLIHLCKAIYYQTSGDKSEMIKVCESALETFKNYEIIPNVVIFSFLYRLIFIEITNGNFVKANELIEKSFKYCAYGRHNWQIVMICKVLYGFYSQKITTALEAWRIVRVLPEIQLTKEMNEIWSIMEGYLALYEIELPNKFRLYYFLNCVPISNSDKSGQNINVVIIELMHLLKDGILQKFDHRCDQLNRYISDHLRNKNRERSICFLRMLQCIRRGGYCKKTVQGKARPHLLYLKSTRPNLSMDIIEIVPYEKLWEVALSYLK